VPDDARDPSRTGDAGTTREDPSAAADDHRAPRLDILKALGDNTRYAIYLELARSPLPLSTAEVSDALGLHVNTVRPHLERMRDVGLLEVASASQGEVGRPQHRYSLAPDAPSLGLEPPALPTLAQMLLSAAHAAGLPPEELTDAGREQGRADGHQWPPGTSAVEALEVEQARLGFDPAVIELEAGAVMAFAHCPFRALAEQHPDLVCSLHRGLVEGLVDEIGGVTVAEFHPLVDRAPCQVELALVAAANDRGAS
jgi:predicted ArsR family transcriptional regulator